MTFDAEQPPGPRDAPHTEPPPPPEAPPAAPTVEAPEAPTAEQPPPGPPPTDPGLARHGIVRPLHGRYLAGVCAGIGRATNTDPVLWRVLIAVLTLFGGIGLLVYLVGWLVIPAEGDSASPVEALIGRGQSRTNPLVVVLVGVLAVIMLTLIVRNEFFAAVLGATVLVAVLLLISRPKGTGVPPPPPPYMPQPPYPPPAPGPFVPYVPPQQPTPAASGTQVTAMQPAPPVPPLPGPPPPPMPPPMPPGGFRPPFAPHGPYAGPPPPFVPPPPPPKPKPPKEKSPLGQIVLSMACVAIGVLFAVDLSGQSVPGSAYLATILAVIGLGLLVGAWYGRARLLIVLGLVMATILGFTTAVEGFNQTRYPTDLVWSPQTMEDLASRYDLGAGDVTLDLRNLDFTGLDKAVTATVKLGSLRVLVPERVDTTVDATVSAGEATVFGENWGGLNTGRRELRDLGTDGAGGGTLRLSINVNAGELEVSR